jgi:hypothetical protein
VKIGLSADNVLFGDIKVVFSCRRDYDPVFLEIILGPVFMLFRAV